MPKRCEFIIDPWRYAGRHFACEIAVAFQPPQRRREHLLRDRSNAALDLGKTHASTRKHGNHQNRPLVANPGQNVTDRLANSGRQIAEAGDARAGTGHLQVTRFRQGASSWRCSRTYSTPVSVAYRHQTAERKARKEEQRVKTTGKRNSASEVSGALLDVRRS